MPGNLFRKNLRGDSNIRQRIQQILWLLDTMAMPSRIHLHHSYVYAPRCFEKPIQLFFGFLTRFRVIRFTRSKRPRRRLNVSPLIRRIDSTFNNGNAVKKNRVNVEFFAGFLENTSLGSSSKTPVPSRMEQKCSVRLFLTTPECAVFLPMQ